MAELVSAEEGIEKGRAPHVDGLYVGVWGSWAYLKQAPSESLSMAAFFCGWRSYPPPYCNVGELRMLSQALWQYRHTLMLRLLW